MSRKSDDEILKELAAELIQQKEKHQKIQDQIRERIRTIDARLTAKNRRIDARRKILAGVFLLHHVETNPKIRLWFVEQFPKFSAKQTDTDLFSDLIPKAEISTQQQATTQPYQPQHQMNAAAITEPPEKLPVSDR